MSCVWWQWQRRTRSLVQRSGPLHLSEATQQLVQIPSFAHLIFCCEYYPALWWSLQHPSFSKLNYQVTGSSREVPCFSYFRIRRTWCKRLDNETDYFRTGSEAVLFKGKNGHFCHMWMTALFKVHVLRRQKSKTESTDTTSDRCL